jgi:hypothetical protein
LETLLVIIYSLFFIFLIKKLPFFETEGVSKNTLSAIFVVKLVFGFLVAAVYTYYYTDRATADVFKYFDASKVMFDTLTTNPAHFFKMLFGVDCNGAEFSGYYDKMDYWCSPMNSSMYNDSHLIIRINTIIRFFSFGYFHVHTVFFCFFSLVGLTAIYKTFIPVLKDKSKELLCVVFFVPSVLFWGSGALKEGVVLFSIGLLIYHFNKSVNVKSVFICLGMTLLLGVLKFYVLVALVPGLLFMFWINQTTTSKLFLKFITVITVTVTLGLNINRFTGIPDPFQILSQKQEDFNKLAGGLQTGLNNKPIPKAGSVIKINKIEPTFLSFVKNSPQAFVNTLLRPFVWESRSPIILMASIENMVVILFIILCLLFSKPFKKTGWQYVLFCLSFSVIQLLFIGSTIPVVGAIVRYKVPVLPFLLITFLLMLDKEKISTKFSLYSKIFK